MIFAFSAAETYSFTVLEIPYLISHSRSVKFVGQSTHPISPTQYDMNDLDQVALPSPPHPTLVVSTDPGEFDTPPPLPTPHTSEEIPIRTLDFFH